MVAVLVLNIKNKGELKMTKEKLIEMVTERVKEDISITADMISSAVDIVFETADDIMSNKKSEYDISIWDKVSSINGVDPSYILKDPPHTLPEWTGLTLLIGKDGKTIYIQPSDFREQGWQPITSETMAFELADIMLIPMLEEAVIEEVIKKLRGE